MTCQAFGLRLNRIPIAVASVLSLAPNLRATAGLDATYSDGKNVVRLVVPSPNFTLAPNESVHPQVASQFDAVYIGALKIERGGEYILSGEAHIEIGGKDVSGKTLKLIPGEHPLEITFQRKTGPARLQARWKSDFFAEEPIPASAYVHAKQEEDDLTKRWASIEHGRLLYEDFSCGACHGVDEWQLSTRQGPDLSMVGARVNGDWLQAWLRNPKHYRSSSAMPVLLTRDDEVRDVTAFLLSLAKSPFDEAETSNAGRIEAGKELFNEVGCAKCHAMPEHSLAKVGGKYRSSQALARYLLDPLSIDLSGRMPQMFDPKTQAHEAALVAEYLFHEKSKAWPKFSGGDAFRGRKLVQARGCVACHSLKYGDQFLPDKLDAPQFTTKDTRFDPQKGCLANAPAKGSPNYKLSAEERSSLRAFLASTVKHPIVAKAPLDTFHRRLKQFNCAACHSSQTQVTDLLTAIERPPSLEGAGDKLKPDWIRRVLLEKKRTRHWMKMRMPHFGNALKELTHLFPAAAGSTVEDKSPTPDLKVAENGLQNVAICAACHDYRGINRQNEGVVPAPDLAEVGETLRHDWFRRWIRNPQRIRPGTSMPQFFAELKGAGRERKIDELWATLFHQKKLPLPEGLTETLTEGSRVVVGDDPVVFRVATKLSPDRQVDRAINVGLPGGMNYTFDAAGARLRGAWKGEFINAGPAWSGRGGKPVNVVAESIYLPPDHFPVRIAAAMTQPEVRFLGYYLVRKHPVFRYAVDGTEVHERIEVTDKDVVRRFTVADAPNPVFFVDDKEMKYVSASGKFRDGVLEIPAGKNLEFEVSRPLPTGQTVKVDPLTWIAAAKGKAPKSKNGEYVAIIFENKSGRKVKLFWVDYGGKLQAYGVIAPGATRRQSTYSNNIWMIADENDNPLGHFIAGPNASRAVIPKQ